MDLSPFKRDIDELINEFAEAELTTFADMKRVWLSRKFSYIYEASPTTHLALFMQSLFVHAIGHMVRTDSLSRRLGGLYCLYCLHETQPFKPPFRIYVSIRELGKIKDLVVEAKDKGINVIVAVVKRMLEKNMFLFGSVDLNEASITQKINHLMELQNARVQIACDKLFENTRIEHFLHMDLGKEVDLEDLKKMSTEYAEAKKRAIKGASKVVDVQNIKHIAEDKELIGDSAQKINENWNAQKEAFYQQTGLKHGTIIGAERQEQCTEQEDDCGFDELERLIFQS